jgi:aminomethyltransferase
MSPLWANVAWAIKLTRPDAFIGQESLQKETSKGLSKRLVALKVLDRRIARQGSNVCGSSGSVVGQVTSGTFSPHLNAPIALALIDNKVGVDEPLFAEVRADKLPTEICRLPFVPAKTRTTPKMTNYN